MQNRLRRLFLNLCGAAFATMALSSMATAQVKISEILRNPPGTDNGKEFIEFLSDAPNFSLNDVVLVIVDGDGDPADPTSPVGQVDQVLTYTGQSTGSNRLFLHRDGSAVLSPAPDSATRVLVRDFVPDLENGSATYLLVKLKAGVTITPGQDLDQNNDGVIDDAANLFDTVYHAVAFGEEENDVAIGTLYAAQFGGHNFLNNIFTSDVYALAPTGKGYISDALVDIDNGGVDATGPWIFDNESVYNDPNFPRPPLGRGECVNEGNEFLLVKYQLSPGRLNAMPLATMKGQVLLQSRPTLNQNVRLHFRALDVAQADFEITVTPAADGTLPEIPDIPAASYDIYVKYPNYLQKRVSLDFGTQQPVNFSATVLPGDLFDDELVDLLDLVKLFDTYGLAPGDEGYLDAADFNGDEIVDLLDLVILFNVYGEEGDLFE